MSQTDRSVAVVRRLLPYLAALLVTGASTYQRWMEGALTGGPFLRWVRVFGATVLVLAALEPVRYLLRKRYGPWGSSYVDIGLLGLILLVWLVAMLRYG